MECSQFTLWLCGQFKVSVVASSIFSFVCPDLVFPFFCVALIILDLISAAQLDLSWIPTYELAAV